MNNFDYKKILPYVGVVLFFVTISLAYFYPQLQGKQLATHDQKQWKGGVEEINHRFDETGKVSLWSNSMFGGMPAYYVGMRYPGNLISKYVRPITKLGLERPALYIFWSLISFFILMMVLKVDIPIGILGSVGYAFTSYNFVILAAGHFAKVMALGYLPGILAGAILLRQKKYVLGFTVTALFMSFEMISNHPQMTYYFFVFFISIYFLLEFFSEIKKGEVKSYIISAAIFGGAIILGLLPSASQLMTTQEYTANSTRGKSELTITNKDDATTGLDRSYITNWSGGIAETWSLLIPHAKGPGSSAIATHKVAMNVVDRKYKKPMEGVSAYWGDQPFVGGPMYAGAIIIFLFVLSWFVVGGTLKWALVFATVFTTMLSWGKNFPGLTNFFIDYFPMYNKFRAVVSIEIVALFAIPVLAALALKKVFGDKEFLSCPMEMFGKKCNITNERAIIVAFVLTGGVSLVFWLMPTLFFDFFKTGEYDSLLGQLSGSGWQPAQIDDLLNNIEAARIALFKADALRSFAFILGAAGLMMAYAKGKMKGSTSLYIIAALVLVDMWGVNTRYMDVTEGFEKKKNVTQPFKVSTADQAILADKAPDKRVLNIAVSTFNETGTSFFHHSIGGYNGAKMKKYQEVVEFYISKEIQKFQTGLQGAKSINDILPVFNNIPVLNMLNTKYVIYDPNAQPLVNPAAQGGAWFIENVKWVETADDEMIGLGEVDLRNTAVIRNDQKNVIGKVGNGNGSINLVSYDLDKLVYQSSSTSDQVAVLSEIWYPVGWIATIDNQEVEIGRANYLLRTISIPAGEHKIEFVFAPNSYYLGENIALAGSSLLIILIFGSLYLVYVKGGMFKNKEG
jgi:hypothetical protein